MFASGKRDVFAGNSPSNVRFVGVYLGTFRAFYVGLLQFVVACAGEVTVQDFFCGVASARSMHGYSAKESWQQADPFPIADNIGNLKVAVWEACKCKTQLEAALVYAEYGIPVLPCLPQPLMYKSKIKKLKSPIPELGEGGLYHATIDPAVIREWWTTWPDALIGVPMGRRTGIWAGDVDAKDAHKGNGIAAWERLEVQYGPAGTRTHLTGTEGLHLLYLWDDNRFIDKRKGKLPEGIEVRGESGYVIFPLSPYQREGKASYRTSNDCEPEHAPSWLYDLILGARAKSNGAGGPWTWSEGFGQKKLVEICEIVRTAQKCEWDATRRKVFFFGRLAGGGLSITKQAAALNISRGSVYYLSRPVSATISTGSNGGRPPSVRSV
jgi:hypothetical protein